MEKAQKTTKIKLVGSIVHFDKDEGDERSLDFELKGRSPMGKDVKVILSFLNPDPEMLTEVKLMKPIEVNVDFDPQL